MEQLFKSMFISTRSDELDYKIPLEGQELVAFEDHWRKHTLAFQDPDSGKVCHVTSIQSRWCDPKVKTS